MFLQPVSRFLSWHFYVLFQYFDPIVSDSSKPVKSNIPKWDPSFVFPVIFMLFTLINCNVILPVYEYDVSLTLTDLLSSSALFFRQMFPEVIPTQFILFIYLFMQLLPFQEMRPLTDVALVIGVSASFAIYISFWNNPWTLNRFCGETLGKRRRILRFGQSKQREESSRKIQKYHKRIKAVSFNSITFIVIFSSIFFYINLYLTSIYHVSINLLFICFVIIPINTWYVFYGKLGLLQLKVCTNS